MKPRSQTTPPPPRASYDSRWYVPREFEEREAQRCLAHHQPVLLWGPRGQGCSWLCHRIADIWRLAGPGRASTIVDFRTFVASELDSLDSCLLTLAVKLERALAPPPPTSHDDASTGKPPPLPLTERWAAMPGAPNWRFSRTLESMLDGYIEHTDAQIETSAEIQRDKPPNVGAQPTSWLLVLDHADRVHECSFYEDFANLLRGCAEQDAPPWDRLLLMVAVSVPPEHLRTAQYASPFANLADPIEVGDLDLGQVTELAHSRGLPDWTAKDSDALCAVLGGHPHLSCIALDDLREGRYQLSDLASGADSTGTDPLRDSLMAAHMQRLRKRLDREPLRRAFVAILHGRGGGSREEINELVGRGLVTRSGEVYTVRYPVYRRLLNPGANVFDARADEGTARARPAWAKVAAGAAIGTMFLAVLVLLLPSTTWRLTVGGTIGLGVLVFIIVNSLNPAYFYRRLLAMTITCGLAIHATGFTVKAGSLLEWDNQTGGLFTIAWVALIGMLIWAEHREKP